MFCIGILWKTSWILYVIFIFLLSMPEAHALIAERFYFRDENSFSVFSGKRDIDIIYRAINSEHGSFRCSPSGETLYYESAIYITKGMWKVFRRSLCVAFYQTLDFLSTLVNYRYSLLWFSERGIFRWILQCIRNTAPIFHSRPRVILVMTSTIW